nr:MAG TPA: hypothetical protein [Caudoviricetes sp.]
MVPRRPQRPCRWTAPPGVSLASDPHTAGADPRRAGIVCNLLHSYIPYYNRAAVLTCTASGVALVSGMCWRCCGACVCSNVARAVQYRQMYPPHNGGKTRQIAGKAPVKPCALFCGVGGILALTRENAL